MNRCARKTLMSKVPFHHFYGAIFPYLTAPLERSCNYAAHKM